MNVNTLNSDHKLASWARLVRLHTMLPTALIPLIFYMVVMPLTVKSALAIVSFASLSHFLACTTNDLFDYPDDKQAVDKQHRPLVSGEIKPIEAFTASLAILTSILISPFVIVAMFNLNPSVMIALYMSVGAGIFSSLTYNGQSGQRWYADLLYVISILSLGAFGTALAGEVTSQSILLFIAFTIHGFYQVQEGHMKDLVEDEENVIQKLGLSVMESGAVKYPVLFKETTMGLKIIEFLCVASIALLYNSNIVSVIGLALLGFAFVLSTRKWLVSLFDRDYIVKWITVHELVSIILILTAIVSYDPKGTVFFVIATPIWLIGVNYFIHDDILSPDI